MLNSHGYGRESVGERLNSPTRRRCSSIQRARFQGGTRTTQAFIGLLGAERYTAVPGAEFVPTEAKFSCAGWVALPHWLATRRPYPAVDGTV